MSNFIHVNREKYILVLKTCSRVFIILGDALVKTRARRDDARFLGRENTVPVRLVYRMDGDSQAAHDVLNTRVRLSSDRKQVCIFHLMFGCICVSGTRMLSPPVAIGDTLLLDRCLCVFSFTLFPSLIIGFWLV